VYAFGEDTEYLKKVAEEFLEGKGQVFMTKTRNHGARIENTKTL
jgi:predicted sugar kinase